jgi:hypothetical protein
MHGLAGRGLSRINGHYPPIRMAKAWNTDTSNAGEDVEQKGLSLVACGNFRDS